MQKLSLRCALAAAMFLSLFGCFSIARYESNVRPGVVNPSAVVTGKYRLERILLCRNDFAECGSISEAEYVELRWRNFTLETLEKSKNLGALLAHELVENDWHRIIKDLDSARAFGDFAKRFEMEQPLYRKWVAKGVQEYKDAVESGDAELKANCITNMVAMYCGVKGIEEQCKKDKETARKYTDSNIARLGCNNAKEMWDRDYSSDYRTVASLGKDGKSVKMYFDAVQSSLLKNYPNVFTTSAAATPITVLVGWDNKFDDHHSYGALLCFLGFPLTQEVETIYHIRVVLDAGGRSDVDLWNEYANSWTEYPPAAQNGGAVRQRNMWTSMLLPISLIGIPGNSDWPKKRKAFTMGSTIIAKEREEYCRKGFPLPQEEYMETFVFDPVSDGDIIAALIMRSLNKMAESK